MINIKKITTIEKRAIYSYIAGNNDTILIQQKNNSEEYIYYSNSGLDAIGVALIDYSEEEIISLFYVDHDLEEIFGKNYDLDNLIDLVDIIDNYILEEDGFITSFKEIYNIMGTC